MADFKQLDIYWIDLGSTKDAETKNLRPYVIIQGDFIKDALNIVFDL